MRLAVAVVIRCTPLKVYVSTVLSDVTGLELTRGVVAVSRINPPLPVLRSGLIRRSCFDFVIVRSVHKAKNTLTLELHGTIPKPNIL